jgi:hypothetical protein
MLSVVVSCLVSAISGRLEDAALFLLVKLLLDMELCGWDLITRHIIGEVRPFKYIDADGVHFRPPVKVL